VYSCIAFRVTRSKSDDSDSIRETVCSSIQIIREHIGSRFNEGSSFDAGN
jgi:hypothetical protein